MIKKYTSAFILPLDTVKTLSDEGWEFESNKTLSIFLINKLINALNAIFVEDFEDIKKYKTNDMELNLLFSKADNLSSINHVHIKIYEPSVDDTINEISSILNSSELTLFCPSRDN